MPFDETITKPLITFDDEVRIIGDIIIEQGRSILSIPGLWQILSEEFNNEIISRFEEEQTS